MQGHNYDSKKKRLPYKIHVDKHYCSLNRRNISGRGIQGPNMKKVEFELEL